MPVIYLSPSTQDWNAYVTGSGSEEYQMNLIADALEPYLLASGIRFTRNRPEMTAGSSIRQANSGNYDLYLALHSNAAPEGRYGEERGILVFYYPTSTEGRRAADLIVQELRDIYPLPEKVSTRSTTTLGEVRLSRAPAVLSEIGYHDNYADARWVETHTDAIAQQLGQAVTAFFSLPFFYPLERTVGTVDVDFGTLNLRSRPDSSAPVIANMPDGAKVTVYGEWQGWYTVHYRNLIGYAAAAYIDT